MTEPAIRKMRDTEAAALAALEKECFPDPWSEKSLEDMQKSPHTLYLVAETEGEIVGYCGAQIVLDEGYIGNVGVRSAFRRRGIADRLLEALDKTATENALSFLTLEVRAGNLPAIALYEKHDYKRVGIRPAYYQNPKEDAILMTKYC